MHLTPVHVTVSRLVSPAVGPTCQPVSMDKGLGRLRYFNPAIFFVRKASEPRAFSIRPGCGSCVTDDVWGPGISVVDLGAFNSRRRWASSWRVS